ncbi:MAG: MATE family efflux transporter [Victivallales bacterium]
MRKIFTLNKDFRGFLSYTVPAAISMLLSGIYILVDGLFVGWGAGTEGLAAINVAYPFACLYLGIGEMLGNGSAITIAYCRGRDKLRTAGLFFGNLIFIMIPLGIILGAVSPLTSRLVGLMGADEAIFVSARNYALIVSGGCVFQIVTCSLLAVMRHTKAQYSAMFIMLAGLIANIVLDYWMVIAMKWGVEGSAWATILAQLITCILAVGYFMRGKVKIRFRFAHLRPYASILGKIMLTGLPSFGLQLAATLVILLHNISAGIYGGLTAIAAYAIIASVVEVVMLMDGGFSTGIQPLVSFFNGTGERTRRKRIFRYGMLAALIFGVVAMIATIWGRALIVRAFNATPELAAITFRGLILSSFGFVSLGLFQVMCAYLQAKGRHTLSSILIYADCLVAMPLALVILPLFFKLDGVWLAMPVSKLVMMAAAAMVTFRWKDTPAALIRRKLLITKKIVKMLWM